MSNYSSDFYKQLKVFSSLNHCSCKTPDDYTIIMIMQYKINIFYFTVKVPFRSGGQKNRDIFQYNAVK